MTTAAIHVLIKSCSSPRLLVSCFQSKLPLRKLHSNSLPKRVTHHVPITPMFFSTAASASASATATSTSDTDNHSFHNLQAQGPMKINLQTIPTDELTVLLKSWGQPSYRAKQIHHWVREHHVCSVSEMTNLPKSLLELLEEHTTLGNSSYNSSGNRGDGPILNLAHEQISKDGTIKRAYELHDGQMIESVLMPYENKNGRYTACISSQAGCAMGCQFCATGQMGFARQLTSDEIYEQVLRFNRELQQQGAKDTKNGKGTRVSNVVMMGMGEPLANYKNVLEAIRRMNQELGIGARKITISTVGIVPNIKKLITETMQVRLAISLHCASDDERSRLLPANRRYGGLDELMLTIKEYTDVTKRRITLEWALIENQNDTPTVARQLGKLLKRFNLRMDLIHINLIPLNPTGGFEDGRPSGKKRVDRFVQILESEFGVSATPRMRRGIDIDAGCGQLKSKIKKNELKELENNVGSIEGLPTVGVYDDDENDYEIHNDRDHDQFEVHADVSQTLINEHTINLDMHEDGIQDKEFETPDELKEAERLIKLVQTSFPKPTSSSASNTEQKTPQLSMSTTTITDETSLREAKRRRKKLIKNLKMIENLLQKESDGLELNEEQRIKVLKKEQWRAELESVEHNLK